MVVVVRQFCRLGTTLMVVVALSAGLLAASVSASAATTHSARTHSAPKHSARKHSAGAHSARMHSARSRSTRGHAAVTPAVPLQPRSWGITSPDLPWNSGAMSQLTANTDSNPGVVMWYVAWSLGSDFPTWEADQVRSWGATPEITWEPWDPSAGVDQPAYSLARISGGAFDAYLTRWAQAAAAWGHPVRLRFAHEMNGNWYPWDQGVNGNAAGSYVKAWKHVHQIFDAAGATNVTWVWSPNIPFPGSTPLRSLFPGDALVDEVALDGYNWGTAQGGQWTGFAAVFRPGLQELTALSTRPVSIGEVGCPEAGEGAKATWMHNMWRTLAAWPQVRGLMWFDFDKEADWRIDSSATSRLAFRSGLANYLAG